MANTTNFLVWILYALLVSRIRKILKTHEKPVVLKMLTTFLQSKA